MLIAFVCCALVLCSFALFARDQLAGASEAQQQELVSGPTAGGTPVPTNHQTGQPRRFIDGAAKTLTAPFSSIVSSSSEWVTRGLPTVFALIVYGVGLGYLARYSRGVA